MGCGCNECKDPTLVPIGPRGLPGSNGTSGGAGERGKQGEPGTSITGDQGLPGEDGYGYDATSSDPLAVLGTAITSISTTIDPKKAYSPGARVRFSDTAFPATNFFEGICTAYSPVTGAISVGSIDVNKGSGIPATWDVNLAGEIGVEGDKGDIGDTGDKGDGFTGGSHDSGSGITTFTSDDGLGFSTSDLRGGSGEDGRGYDATSSDSISNLDTLATTVTATIETEKAYTIGARVRFSDRTTPDTNYFEGICTAYNPATGVISLGSIDLHRGLGTLSTWDVNLAGERGSDVYDSGWQLINDYDGSTGMAPLTGSTHLVKPYIRVVGRIFYINGFFMIPLAENGASGTLRTNYGVSGIGYQDTHRADSETFTGNGGYTLDSRGHLTSTVPLLPLELRPSYAPSPTSFIISNRGVPAYRFLFTTESAGGATVADRDTTCVLETHFWAAFIHYNGKIQLTTHKDIDDSGGGFALNNSPIHKLISNVSAGDTVPTFTGKSSDLTGAPTTTTTSGTLTVGAWYKIVTFVAGDDFVNAGGVNVTGSSFYASNATPTTWANGSTLERNNLVNYSSFHTYPSTVNGEEESELGGFRLHLNLSYALDDAYTEAEIRAAFESIG
jgi:hypothetical protein